MNTPSGMPSRTPSPQPAAMRPAEAATAPCSVPSSISSSAAAHVASGDGKNNGEVRAAAKCHRTRPPSTETAVMPSWPETAFHDAFQRKDQDEDAGVLTASVIRRLPTEPADRLPPERGLARAASEELPRRYRHVTHRRSQATPD